MMAVRFVINKMIIMTMIPEAAICANAACGRDVQLNTIKGKAE
jgi:hypothetical protein